MSNFAFLETATFRDIPDLAKKAEQYALSDPRAAMIYSRLCIEYAVYWLFEHDQSLPRLGQLRQTYGKYLSLDELINLEEFRDLIDDEELYQGLFLIKAQGNKAVHKNRESITKETAISVLSLLYRFLLEMAAHYQDRAPEIKPFDKGFLNTTSGLVPESTLKELSGKVEALEENLKTLQQQKLEITEELERLEAEREKFRLRRLQNAQALHLDRHVLTEDETRLRLIDTQLLEAGWDPQGENVNEFEIDNMPLNVFPTGKGRADYVLWDDNGLPLAVVEAKKTMYNAAKGRHQALLYAEGLERIYNQKPIIFYSNGFQHYIWDDQFYPPRQIFGFLTKDELQRAIQRRATRRHLLNIAPNREIVGGQNRSYQLEAVNSVMKRFCDKDKLIGKHRKGLLVMATGAGKTRTAAAIIELLTKANWVKRALFLADRVSLVRQAKNDIASYLTEYSCHNIVSEKDDENTRIVFSTYQTIINKIDGDEKPYSIGHFDLIIVDEAHRSIYNKYRSIFDYFDSLVLGLTATPKDEVEKDTFEFFGCSPGDPTYEYTLEQAAEEGHLLMPQSYQVDLGFVRSGIKYDDLSEQDKRKYEETFMDEDGNLPPFIDSSAINNWLFNRDSVKKVIDYLMTKGIKVDDQVGKTIIFANNQRHAELIQECFEEEYPEYGGEFCAMIHYKVDKAEDLIDRFKDPVKLPRIAISVDMLDTGIDVPEIVNLVMFKPVYSKSKFWQMIGRGTRKCQDLFGPGLDKETFFLFDFCGNFAFFNQNPNGIENSPSVSLSEQIFIKWLELSKILSEPQFLDDQESIDFRKKILDMIHFELKKLEEKKHSVAVRRVLEYLLLYLDRSKLDYLDATDRKILKDHIAPIVFVPEPDTFAKRFDHFMWKMELDFLEQGNQFENYIERVKDTARKLMQKMNVPDVALHREFIQRLSGIEFWVEVSIQKLDAIRLHLRKLIKHLDRGDRRLFYTDFEDEIVSESEIPTFIKPTAESAYKNRLESLLRRHSNELAVSKIRKNETITEAELEHLKGILLSDIEEDKRQGFSEFLGKQSMDLMIRQLLGLDEEAVKMAFAEFERKYALSDIQMRFLKVLVHSISIKGVISLEEVYEGTQFKDIHDGGIDAVFPGQRADEIFEIIKKFQSDVA